MTKNIDRKAMKRLEKMGFGLEGIRSVEFYFYCKHEHQAFSIAAELNNLQFETSVSDRGDHRGWSCLAIKSINMSAERLEDLRIWMENLARQYGGEYDGWGTEFTL